MSLWTKLRRPFLHLVGLSLFCAVKGLGEPFPRRPDGVEFGRIEYTAPCPARDLRLEKAVGGYYSLGHDYELAYAYCNVKLTEGARHVLAAVDLDSKKGRAAASSCDVLMLFRITKAGDYKLEQLFADPILPVLISSRATNGYRDIIYCTRRLETEGTEYREFKFFPLKGGYPGWPDSRPVRQTVLSGTLVLTLEKRETLSLHKFRL